MWPKFCNSFSIYMKGVIITSILQGFVAIFFERYSWLKFNNLGLVLGTALRFYTSVAKGLELKVRKFWGLIFTFLEVTGGKTSSGGNFLPPIMNMVNFEHISQFLLDFVSLILIIYFFTRATKSDINMNLGLGTYHDKWNVITSTMTIFPCH